MTTSKCSKCGSNNLSQYGTVSSKSLVVLDYPDYVDQKAGRILSENSERYQRKMRTIDILRPEFARVGLNLSSLHVITMWTHTYTDNCEEEVHIDAMTRQFKNRKKILLMGSASVNAMFGKNAIDLCGVWQYSKAFPGICFMPCISPETVTMGDLGELRLALQRFSDKKE